MTNQELIEYCKQSIKDCDAFRAKHKDTNAHLATVFEGMSEAYCDLLNRLLDRPFNTCITTSDLYVEPETAAESEKKVSLCDTCLHGFSCENSDRGISFANHTICHMYAPKE